MLVHTLCRIAILVAIPCFWITHAQAQDTQEAATLLDSVDETSDAQQPIADPATTTKTAERSDSEPPLKPPAENQQPALQQPPTNEDLDTNHTQEANPTQEAKTPVSSNARPATMPHDLSPWGMFQQADWVVKSVMIGLALASFATWVVLLAKSLELWTQMARQRQTLQILSEAQSLKSAHADLADAGSDTDLTHAAAQELRLSTSVLSDTDSAKERVASTLIRLEAARSRKILQGTGILATIGSTAPFVGLFGTVWGIMNSFIGISKAQTTNLAVVAPGIAEALLATALGLIAAIPAVVIYNHFARKIAVYRALVSDCSAAVSRLVSRDLSLYTTHSHDSTFEV